MAERQSSVHSTIGIIGLVLLLIGIFVFLIGMYFLIFPATNLAGLRRVHPNLWWGGLILVVGGLFLFINNGTTTD